MHTQQLTEFHWAILYIVRKIRHIDVTPTSEWSWRFPRNIPVITNHCSGCMVSCEITVCALNATNYIGKNFNVKAQSFFDQICRWCFQHCVNIRTKILKTLRWLSWLPDWSSNFRFRKIHIKRKLMPWAQQRKWNKLLKCSQFIQMHIKCIVSLGVWRPLSFITANVQGIGIEKSFRFMTESFNFSFA